MTTPIPASAVAEAVVVSAEPRFASAPPTTPAPLSKAEADALLLSLARELSRTSSRITSASRKRELARQAALLDAAFYALLSQGTYEDEFCVAALRTALQSQQLYLQLVQQLARHDKKIRHNELIRNKRPRRHTNVLPAPSPIEEKNHAPHME